MSDVLTFYLKKIERLRIDRSHGRSAPHKPVLLLAVIDLFEQGAITQNFIAPSPELVGSFLKYWQLVRNEKPRIFLPFFHLRSDGFWHLTARPGNEEVLKKIKQIGSMAQVRNLIEFASLDEELFILLHQTENREIFRRKIIETYFSDRAAAFQTLITENKEIGLIENILLERAAGRDSEIPGEIKDTPKRNIAFRRLIIRLYDYTCAACQLRIVTADGETAVEAAHIYPFAQSFDDSIGNGLALCPLHHWSFDKGLFSIDDDYRMVIGKNFEESGNEPLLLRNLQTERILLPKEKPFRPSLTMIRWHRNNLFQK